MEHISNTLKRRIRQSGLEKSVSTALIIEEVEKILKEQFGANILNKAKPLYIKDSILTLACLSSVINQEISIHKQNVIEKINKKFNRQVINDIRFTL